MKARSLYLNRRNHIGVVAIVDDSDYAQQTGIWISGRVFGFTIDWFLPWRKRVTR